MTVNPHASYAWAVPDTADETTASDDRRLVNMLGALSLGVADAMREATEKVTGLTDAAPAAIVAIAETGPGISINDLRRMIGLTHSGAVRLVDRLVDAGYVERRAGRNDRSVGLKLTRRGAAMARKVRAARADAVGHAVASLDPADRVELARLADMLITSVTEQRLARRAAGEAPAGGALCRLCDFVACGRPEGLCPAARTAAELSVPYADKDR